MNNIQISLMRVKCEMNNKKEKKKEESHLNNECWNKNYYERSILNGGAGTVFSQGISFICFFFPIFKL